MVLKQCYIGAMFVALNLLMYLGVCLLFGYCISRFVLRFTQAHIIVPATIILGISADVFFVNILSYVIPIQASVWLVLALMLLVSLMLIHRDRERENVGVPVFEIKESRIIFGVALFISLLSGLVALKSLGHDDFFMGHMPLASTIASGNFPVMDPSAPDQPLSYHYASELMSANLHMVTGVPVWLAYDLQIFLFTGALFLLLFALIFKLAGAFWPALVGAALFFYGSGLQWINIFTEGFPALWHRYILHENMPTFWKWVVDVTFPKLNSSYIFVMNNHSVAIGMPVLILTLYLYILALREKNVRRSWVFAICAGLFFGYSALSIETYFAVLFIALALSILAIHTRKHITITLLVLGLGLAIALLQGGIFSRVLSDSGRDTLTLVSSWQEASYLDLAPNPAKIDNSATFVKLFSPEFFIQFGLPIILIIPAIWFFYKRRDGGFLLLALIGVGAFAMPIIFRYHARPWEMSRFFALAIPIFAMLVGVWLMRELPNVSGRLKHIILVCVFLLGASGFLSQVVFAISSLDRFGSLGPLIARPPDPTPADLLAYDWIRANTTLIDRFFPYSEEFVRHTGRFTPGAYPYFTFRNHDEEQRQYDKIVKDCNPNAFAFFKIDYVFVSPENPLKTPQTCMTKFGASVAFQSGQGPDTRILYKIPR